MPMSMVRLAAGYIVKNGPISQQDRWEEDAGYSPFTLSVEVAALLVAADLAGIGGGGLLAFRILGVPNQVWLQLPVAIILSVGLFCAWILALRPQYMRCAPICLMRQANNQRHQEIKA